MASPAALGATRRPATMMALAAVLVAGMAVAWAQSVCRGECDEDFRACQRACAMAQSFDACIGSCRQTYDQCVAACG